jgi:hypothetical protein
MKLSKLSLNTITLCIMTLSIMILNVMTPISLPSAGSGSKTQTLDLVMMSKLFYHCATNQGPNIIITICREY